MSVLHTLALSLLLACGVDYTAATPDAPATGAPDEVAADTQGSCSGMPDAGPTRDWRHTSSTLVAAYGESHHRGVDLIAASDDPTQTIAGRLTYGGTDKDLEDEDVTVFACARGAWQRIGAATTDGDGRFSLALAGDARLPVGLRDLYVSVDGDRTGAAFLALVAQPGAPVIASDLDGTLTASENEYPTALVVGGDVAAQPGAAQALAFAAARGTRVVYISSRGDRFTQDTRDWLVAKGFPRGPLRLAEPIVTLPGDDTVDFKTSALASLSSLQLVAGLGNRATDVAAYGNAGLSSDRIFIKLPEFTEETSADLAASRATGFDAYDLLRTHQMAALLP